MATTPQRLLDLLEKPEFIADLNGGDSIRDVAQRHGASYGWIQKLRAEGVSAPKPKPKTETVAATYKFEQGANDFTANSPASETPQTVDDVQKFVVDKGMDPTDWDLQWRFSEWEQGSKGGGVKTLHAFRVSGKRKREAASVPETIDPFGVLAQLRSQTQTFEVKAPAEWDDERSAFVLSINDIQLGQAFRGGSKHTIKQFHGYVARAKQRILDLRASGRRLDTLVIIGGGDLVEGCVIYPNQAMSLDMNRKQQIEGVVALLLLVFDTLGPMFSKIKVIAARGNHGEHRINGKYTTLDDNDDTHSFEMVKLALTRDPSFANKIEWTIAESEAGVTTHVFDWVLATTHGDIYAKGVPGATIDKKAHSWYKNMAAGRERFGELGRADVLITHHFHHDKMSDWGSCYWRQTTSQDNGSLYYEQATGEYSEPGMLTFVMTESTRYQDEAVLR